MPLFEYRCRKCEHLEEVLQRHGDPAPAECPECGAKGAMHKEISLTSFQLKGGGWYKDLYSSTPKTSASDTGGGESKSESSSAGKSESKSEPKAEPKAEAKTESKADTKPKKGKGAAKAA